MPAAIDVTSALKRCFAREVQRRAMGHHNEEGSQPRPLRDKRGLVNRVRRLRGQVDAIVRESCCRRSSERGRLVPAGERPIFVA
jgi:hypothetical protein